jgi:hypothetical protein
MTRRGLAQWSALVWITVFSAGCGGTDADQAGLEEAKATELAALEERIKTLEAAVDMTQNPPDRPPGAAVPSPFALAERLDALEGSINNWKGQAATLQAQQAEVRRVLQLLPLDFRLDMRLSLKTTGTLDQILAQISSLTATPIRVQSEDLGEARIPRIREIELVADEQPAREVLAELLIKANPDPTEPQSPADPKLLVVYVVANNFDRDGRQEILVTTRKRAAQRGIMPAVFKTAAGDR